MDLEHLKQWIGRTETLSDEVTAFPPAALAATLDRDDPPPRPGDELPPVWHWLYFLPLYRQSEVGPDGHARRGGFLPPVPLPRRMWAGSRIEFLQPLRIGEAITRHSRVADVTIKQGRSGALVFTQVEHEIAGPQGLAIRERHDIVYRDPPQAGTAPPAPQPARSDEQFARRIVPDPLLLFRYSALTFNGHRIHYDQPYVTGTEGYPGLIVHGPLIATLLLDGLRRQQPQRRVARFEFKAVSPLFDIEPFEVCGRIDGDEATLWARGPQGRLAMQAQVRLG
ncbi:MAG: MaoC family dehydratase N-terminal domain-containing protein [Burkholderiales bacterium]|nr:MaoC family dehydratase N-terminal domain-containing protein [Burkholderiales bacterium]